LKLEWTNVSSRSSASVFFPFDYGFWGPSAAWGGPSGSFPNLGYAVMLMPYSKAAFISGDRSARNDTVFPLCT
jgi:hypothetical protein